MSGGIPPSPENGGRPGQKARLEEVMTKQSIGAA